MPGFPTNPRETEQAEDSLVAALVVKFGQLFCNGSNGILVECEWFFFFFCPFCSRPRSMRRLTLVQQK